MGKAFDPRFVFAWPNARYAVMGAAQASDVVYNILARGAKDRPAEELARVEILFSQLQAFGAAIDRGLGDLQPWTPADRFGD